MSVVIGEVGCDGCDPDCQDLMARIAAQPVTTWRERASSWAGYEIAAMIAAIFAFLIWLIQHG